MARRPGSRGSRSERRAGKQRAQRAREHGLPERRLEPVRARVETSEPRGAEGEGRASDAPPTPALKRGIPTLVWVVGGALAILAGVYVLSQMRDGALGGPVTDPEPAASVSGEKEAGVAEPPVEATASASDAQPTTAAPSPLVSSAPVAASAIAPSLPKVGKPVAPRPKAPTAVTAASAAKPEPPAPVPAPIAPATPAGTELRAPAPVGAATE